MTTFDRSTLPASTYDAFDPDVRPFNWSHPADVTSAPWRVSHADRAEKLLASYGQPDVYVTFYTTGVYATLWVGLRDNRNGETHGIRLRELHAMMKRDGLRAKLITRKGYAHPTHIILSDDLPHDLDHATNGR